MPTVSGGGSADIYSGIVGTVGDAILNFAFADGGILNPHLPPSPKDNRLAYLSDGEGIINNRAVRSIGGKPAIDYINKYGKLPEAFEFGGVSGSGVSIPRSIQPPSISLPSSVSVQSGRTGSAQQLQVIEARYVTDGESKFVRQEDHERMLAAVVRQNNQQMRLYDERQQDQRKHSVAYHRAGR